MSPTTAVRACVAGVTCLSVGVALGFAEAAPLAPGGERELRWLDLEVSPLPGGGPVPLLVAHDGRSVVRVIVGSLGAGAAEVAASSVAPGHLSAQLVVGHAPTRVNRAMRVPLSQRHPLGIDVRLADDGRATGTFAGAWPRSNRSPEPVAVQGAIAGRARDPAADAIDPDAAWPSYLGPTQSFASGGGDAGQPEIITDFNRARMAWASEPIAAPEAGSHRYGACVGVPGAGGGASPLVAGGRVYQFHYRASGDAWQEPHLERCRAAENWPREQAKMAALGWTLDDLRDRWRIEADEELTCIDAASGRTLWRVVWPREGLHYFAHKCGLTNWTGAVAGGRVFVLGGTGRLRAVDADNGDVAWEIDVPGLAEELGELRERALDRRHLAAPTRQFCHALAVAGDLVLAPDSAGRSGVVAVEADTGAVRWHVSERVLPSTVASPLVVDVGGVTLALAVGDGRVVAIDCADGAIAWTSDAVGWNATQPILAGGCLIAQAMGREQLEEEAERFPKDRAAEWAPGAVLSAAAEDHGQIGCWQVTPHGLAERWVTPPEWGAARFTPVAAAFGDRLCFRGKFAYQIVELASGERLARSYLSEPARMDEGHLLALPGVFVAHPDTQHGASKFFPMPNRAGARVGELWLPPHPHATTYQVAMSHAWADGRLFIRGADALYCYDLRKPAISDE